MDDPDTNRKFAESLEADYPILSDPEKKTAAAYGVLRSAGFAGRTTFYIGPEGKILHVDNAVNAKTAGEDVVRTLGELGLKKK